MKYFKTLFLFFISAGFIMLSACSDDDDNPVTPNDKTKYDSYFPMSDGSWWIYETYDLNMDQSRKGETLEFDSVAVTGTELKDEKTATIVSTWTEGEKQNDKYYYVEESKLYVNASALLPQLPIDINIGEEWVILADFFGSTWTLKTQDVENLDINIADGVTGKLNGTFSITASKKGSKNINVDGIDYDCQEFEIKYNFVGDITVSIVKKSLSFELSRSFFFADNKGLISDVFNSKTISVDLGLTSYDYDVVGEEVLMNTMNIGE